MDQIWSFCFAHTPFVLAIATSMVAWASLSYTPKPYPALFICHHWLRLLLLIPVGLYSVYLALYLLTNPNRILSLWGWGGHGYIPFMAMTWSAMALLGVRAYYSVTVVRQHVAMLAVFLFFGLALSHLSNFGFSIWDCLMDLTLPLLLLCLLAVTSLSSYQKEP